MFVFLTITIFICACFGLLVQSEVVQPDGSKVVTFSNGTKKVVSADSKSNSVYFFNGDIKHVKSDQTVVRIKKSHLYKTLGPGIPAIFISSFVE